MLLKVFSGRNTFLQWLIIAIFWLGMLMLPVQIIPNQGFNPLYGFFVDLVGQNPWVIRFLFAVIFFGSALIAHIYAVQYGLFKRDRFHFLFFAPLFIFSSHWAWNISPPIVAFVFILLGTLRLFSIINLENANSEITASAVLFSIASLFYSVLVFDFFLIIIALIIFRRFSFREVLLVMTSFLLPYIYLFSWYYLNDKFLDKWVDFTNQFHQFSLIVDWDYHWINIVFTTLMIIFNAIVILLFLGKFRTKLIQIRNYSLFLVWGLIFSILALFMAGHFMYYHFYMILFLLAFFMSLYFNDNKANWVFEGIILLIIIHKLYIISQIIYA